MGPYFPISYYLSFRPFLTMLWHTVLMMHGRVSISSAACNISGGASPGLLLSFESGMGFLRRREFFA